MKKNISISILFIVLIAAAILPRGAQPCDMDFGVLRAGVGVADITPDVKKYQVPMNGYGDRKRAPATSVHDPLYAKAVAIETVTPEGKIIAKAVIVTTDLCMVTQSLREAVLAKIADLGYTDDNLFLSASHTHSGTASIDTRFPVELVMGKFNRDLFDFTANGIAEAVKKAHANIAPAKIDVVQGQYSELVRNRRKDKYNYETRKFEGEKSTEIDATMSALVIDDLEGKHIAALVVLGSHPTILGPENMAISADWPGSLQKSLSEKLGGAVVLFANGAEGDQAPAYVESKDDFDWADKYGALVAENAFKLAQTAEPENEIVIASAIARSPLPRMKIKVAHGLVLPKFLTRGINRDAVGSAILIGDSALLGLPGEPLHAVGLELAARAKSLGILHPVVVGLANDWVGYLADAKSYEEGGYEANMTLFGPNETALCIDTTVKALRDAMAK